MLNTYLTEQITEFFGYQPTAEQKNVILLMSEFLLSSSSDTFFMLHGYAGTGKTSLIAALVKLLDAMNQKVVLLAPTGRAAKVFSLYANHQAYTIHKKIYRQKSLGTDADFSLNNNLSKHTLFIVDEASMISNTGLSGAIFGTGRLLDDLVSFVYSGEGCRLMVVGDPAQLPPVGENDSPALLPENISGYGLHVLFASLTHVVRQSELSGILYNATLLRHSMDVDSFWGLPVFKVKMYADVVPVKGIDLISILEECYDRDGLEETIVVCRSNKRANIYNRGIRAKILWRESELESGDIVMITKNNYFWGDKEKNMEFIANGDMAIIKKVRSEISLYGFRFVDVTLSFPDFSNTEIDARLLLDTLHSEVASLSREDSEKLYNGVCEDYSDISSKRDRIKKLKEDPNYNALQVKYAYAVTCHKAQGGQWKNVFVDQGFVSEDMITPDYFQWLYTAVTRATGTLYLVNFPESQIAR